MKHCVIDKKKKIEDYFNDLDNLKEIITSKYTFNIPFDNFMIYCTNKVTTLCSIREDKKNPFFFLLYLDEYEELQIYIPIDNLDGEFDVTKINAYKDEDHLKKIFDDFFNNVRLTSRVKFREDMMKMSVSDFKNYIDSLEAPIYNYLYDGVNEFLDAKINVLEFGEINGKHYAKCSIEYKDFLPVYSFVYASVPKKTRYKPGKLTLFIPFAGNNLKYDFGIFYISKNKCHIDKSNDKILLEEFDNYILNIDDTHKLEGEIYEINGFPLDLNEYQIPYINEEAKIDDVKEIFNIENVKKEIRSYVNNEVKIGRTDYYFDKGWFAYTRCKVDSFHSFYVVTYLDENNEPKTYIPKHYNNFYHDYPIASCYPTYDLNIDLIFKNLFNVKEKEVNESEFKIYDIRQARAFGDKTLNSKLIGDFFSSIPHDDFRLPITSFVYGGKIVTKTDPVKNLAYAIIDGKTDDGKVHKVGLYLDIMNQLRAYVPYNDDYERDIVETIMTSM